MKHTVINNNNNNPSGNAGSPSSSTTIPVNNDPNSDKNNGNNPKMNSGNFTGNNNNMNSRRFPGFSHDFGFDGDDDDDDMFANMGGLRSRLNRMGHPFDWGNSASAAARKRRGSGGGGTVGGTGGVSTTGSGVHQEPSTYDPYDQYFQDDMDFPHHFGSPQWGDAFNRFGSGRKRSQFPTQPGQSPPTTGHATQSTTAQPSTASTQPTSTVPTQQQPPSGKLSPEPIDRSGFFDYLPPEFRKYIPASFGFPSMRHHVSSSAQPTAAAAAASPPQQQQQQQQHHRQPQWQQPQHPHSEPNTPNSPLVSRTHGFARGGDLANQRPKYSDAAIQTEDLSSNNHNNNNNNDNVHNNNLSNSNNLSNNLQQHGLRNTVDLGQKTHPEEGEEDPLRTQDRSQSAPPNEKIYVQTANIELKQPPNKAVGKGSVNAGTCMTPQDSQTMDTQQPFSYPEQQQTKQQEPSPQSPSIDENFIRTVPIFVEGRNNNNNNNNNAAAAGQSQSRHPQPTVIKTTNRQPVNNEPMAMKSNAQQEQQQQQPPPTPHTAGCIDKIQNIQKDVLDLMGKVEKFNGARGDKEYMYLDEMLTRNLLKLDTIDTDGKDRIRLARKEAIKCIQASIAVLEAKAHLNLKGAADEAAALAATATGQNNQNTDGIVDGAVSVADGTVTKTEISETETDADNVTNKNITENVSIENVSNDEKSIDKTGSDAGKFVLVDNKFNNDQLSTPNVDDVK